MLTVREAAKRAAVSESLIYGVLKAGRLKGLRIGCRGRGCWRIDEQDFDSWLSTCRVSELPTDDGSPYQFLK